MEIGNLLDKEFKVMKVMTKELGRRLDEQSEKLVFNRELENIKNQTKMKNSITELQGGDSSSE